MGYKVVSMVAILPQHQGKGLGTKIMKFCADIADKDGLPIYLTAFPGARDMYLKLGYKDIANFDMDLNEYGKKYRGFGIYRSYGMLRQPEGSPST
jgi:GNAT superfamily N-acetyltransferase